MTSTKCLEGNMKTFLVPLVLVPLLISLNSLNVSADSSGDITDYYWREFTGAVPSDAIPAGVDKSGKTIYVGQGFFKNIGLLPATIYKGSRTVRVTALGNVYTADKNVKILCSQNAQRYRWVPTKIEDMHLLTNCHLVVGGTETETILNIGRVNHEMEIQVGKVYPTFSPYKGLAIPHNGKEANYKSYEVLTYNCSTKQFCENIGPDVF